MVGSVAKMVTVLLLLLGTLALMTGCAADETPVPEVAPATDADTQPEEEAAAAPTGEAVTAVAEAQPEEEAPEEVPEPTAEPSSTPVVVVDVDSACVDCHTDQERLAELAEEQEGDPWGRPLAPASPLVACPFG